MPFVESFRKLQGEYGNLCVGIDPSPGLVSRWGLENNPSGLRRFAQAILDAATDRVAVVKPQVAYFERCGPEGYRVLSDIIAEARERGLLVIADAKRGDIGSTMDAYAQAWFGESAPFRVDAITANAYLGLGALDPLFRRAKDGGAYVFVVVRSSNPEGTTLQSNGEPPLWEVLLDEISAWSEQHGTETVGAVIGATTISELRVALSRLPDALFLAPGIGAQGASMKDIAEIGCGSERVLANASRSIAENGPDVSALIEAIAEASNS